ncbi:hypothetical protein [Poriferisphaera sp. WC338]|uniref:hypothetical protein n=1 Tax=Poriferisphaera sp. WC338 TaxID=3425129 RepID=UPI003D819EA3
MKRCCIVVLLLIIGLSQFSCASYVAPMQGVSLGSITNTEIKDAFASKPAAAFPASIVAMEVKKEGHWNRYNRYSVKGTQYRLADSLGETDTFESLRTLPMIRQLGPLNPLLAPEAFTTVDDLRQAAAPMKADMLLLYTFDTKSRVHDHDVGPLGLLTLGFLPNQESKANVVASLVLMDVRTGFIYGTTQAKSDAKRVSNSWLKDQARMDAEREAEKKAFEKMVVRFEELWAGVVEEQYRRVGGSSEVD